MNTLSKENIFCQIKNTFYRIRTFHPIENKRPRGLYADDFFQVLRDIIGFCGKSGGPVTKLRLRFFKKIQDWILKSERIRKWILHFFTKQINPRSLGSWCVKGTGESTSRLDSSVPLTHHDPKDLGLIFSYIVIEPYIIL